MDSEKFLSKPDSGRRSFLRKAGVAMSAAVAAAVPGMAKNTDSKNTDADRLARQLGILEDENALRTLHRTYESYLDSGRYEAVVDLFTDDASVVFNGGIFKGRSGVSRLYGERFRSGLTGKKIGPAPDSRAEAEQQRETIKVSADRLSAGAQFPYSIQVGTPMTPDSQLVQMSRLQGEGIMKWCEGGIYEASYVKDAKDGGWKIKRLEYRVSSSTDYRSGRAYANPISVPPFAKTYPEDPAGPDRLITPA
jgi:hypothetical protein